MKKGQIKYLDNGKKVKIIKKVNQKESIVQEIFVDENGKEFPSGEQFVEKFLYDKPVESYKERQIKTLENIYIKLEEKEKQKVKTVNNLDSTIKSFQQVIECNENLIKIIKDKKKLNYLAMFMSGSFSHVVKESYSGIELLTKNTFFELDGDCSYRKIKLLTLFGRSDGDIEYRVNSYSDGSGGSYKIYLFKTKKEALVKCKECFCEDLKQKRLSRSKYEEALKLGVKFSKEETKKYYSQQKESLLQEIKRNEERTLEIKNKKKGLQKNLKEINGFLK